MSANDPAQIAARKIQERYRSFRKKRELAGLALSKTDWSSLLNKVDIVLRTSQFQEAQPKKLSVRGKWIRGLGSAGAIGRVRLSPCFACFLYTEALLHTSCRSSSAQIDKQILLLCSAGER